MRKLSNKTNVDGADGDFLYGRIRNNPGDNTGTPFNELLYGDMHQFFERLMAKSGITPNGLPDNDYSGWQLFDALLEVTSPTYIWSGVISQSGTSNPTFSEFSNKIKGTIALTRVSTGVYTLTYTGSIANIFSTPYLAFVQPISTGHISVEFGSGTTLTIKTKDFSGTVQDAILNLSGLKIEVYK